MLVHVGTDNADREGTTAVVKKRWNLLKRTKQARVGLIILSGILPVIRGRTIDTGNREGWRSTEQCSNFEGKRTWDSWICGAALWRRRICI